MLLAPAYCSLGISLCPCPQPRPGSYHLLLETGPWLSVARMCEAKLRGPGDSAGQAQPPGQGQDGVAPAVLLTHALGDSRLLGWAAGSGELGQVAGVDSRWTGGSRDRRGRWGAGEGHGEQLACWRLECSL